MVVILTTGLSLFDHSTVWTIVSFRLMVSLIGIFWVYVRIDLTGHSSEVRSLDLSSFSITGRTKVSCPMPIRRRRSKGRNVFQGWERTRQGRVLNTSFATLSVSDYLSLSFRSGTWLSSGSSCKGNEDYLKRSDLPNHFVIFASRSIFSSSLTFLSTISRHLKLYVKHFS